MRLDYSPESGDTSSITTVSEMKNHDATIRKVQFLPNSTILASGGGGDGRIYMTDCVNNQVVKYLDPGHLGNGLRASYYMNLIFVPGRQGSACAMALSTIKRWKIKCSNRYNSGKYKCAVQCIEFKCLPMGCSIKNTNSSSNRK